MTNKTKQETQREVRVLVSANTELKQCRESVRTYAALLELQGMEEGALGEAFRALGIEVDEETLEIDYSNTRRDFSLSDVPSSQEPVTVHYRTGSYWGSELTSQVEDFNPTHVLVDLGIGPSWYNPRADLESMDCESHIRTFYSGHSIEQILANLKGGQR